MIKFKLFIYFIYIFLLKCLSAIAVVLILPIIIGIALFVGAIMFLRFTDRQQRIFKIACKKADVSVF